MRRYFLNVFNSQGFALDEEGLEFVDLASARSEAVRSIRSMLAEELKNCGKLDLRGRIEIVDESGAPAAVVLFETALSVRLPE